MSFIPLKRAAKLILTLIALTCIGSGLTIREACAQYENFWAFGDSAGLDFTTSPPTAIKTNINIIEGTASVCDAQGRMLFYTDGTVVWNKDNEVMPNGANLTGLIYHITESTTQGALIVPAPSDPNRYYIFSLGSYGSGMFLGWLYYSEIDMRLNNGKGDVVQETKSKMLGKDFGEQMIAVSGNHCNVWLVASSRLKEEIRCYNITSEGLITEPVVSPRRVLGGLYGATFGSMDVSPDRSKLVFAHSLVVYDFDPATGKAANPVVLQGTDSLSSLYGVAFSPDGSKLYTSDEKRLTYQFDLNAGNTKQVIASKTLLSKEGWAIKRGPDNKIYIAVPGTALSVIHQPNLPGLACDYASKELDLKGNRSFYGLPNTITTVYRRKYYSSRRDTLLCADSAVFRARIANGIYYRWQDGSQGPTWTTDTSGTYWVYYHYYSTECEEHTDTFHLYFRKNRRQYTDTSLSALCAADTILLQAREHKAADYIWENQTSGRERTVHKNGIYWLRYRIDSLCAQYTDTFRISYPEQDPQVSFASDTLFCRGDRIVAKNTSAPSFNSFLWNYGDGLTDSFPDPEHSYNAPGRYKLQLKGWIGEKCADSMAVFITVDSIFPLRFLTEKDTACQGETLYFYPEAGHNALSLHWHYGPDEDMIVDEALPVQHAFSQAGVFALTLKVKNRVCPETVFTDTVTIFPLPTIALGKDSALCWKGKPLLLENKVHATANKYQYLWNTGDTTARIYAHRQGTYSLQLRDTFSGCINWTSIEIVKDCYADIPNAFTPNGDGWNDYFFPRQLLAGSLSHFRMKIMNRWGQVLFTSDNIDGRGWDGRFEGKEQPGGSYVYRVEIIFKDGQTQHYEGAVTIIK